MIVVGQKNGFEIMFDCNSQMYLVYKDGKLIIKDKYKYSDVKTYID